MADPGGEGALRRSWKKDLQQNRPVPLLILLLHAQALKTKAIMLTVNDFLMWTPLPDAVNHLVEGCTFQ
jgi:hypothetical protein